MENPTEAHHSSPVLVHVGSRFRPRWVSGHCRAVPRPFSEKKHGTWGDVGRIFVVVESNLGDFFLKQKESLVISILGYKTP